MKEGTFVRLHSEKWRTFENLIDLSPSMRDPDQLAELYIGLTDDLSFARTFYPSSQTTAYLNTLATKAHQALYSRKRERGDRFRLFWFREVPLELFHSRFVLLFSALVFAAAILIGVLSTVEDTSFARTFLGDEYIDMTLDNISRGDPMAVYKSDSQINMFFHITGNNILVSFFAFVLGIFFTVGSIYILVNNGVMLGVFQTFLAQEGALRESLLAVYVHGTIELTSIVVAAAAGIVMGKGLLFPGTYSRPDAFKVGAMRGMKIIVALIPFFIIAGFFESFITRYTDMPLVLNLSIIGGSLLLVMFYFILWPRSVARSLGFLSNDQSGPELEVESVDSDDDTALAPIAS